MGMQQEAQFTVQQNKTKTTRAMKIQDQIHLNESKKGKKEYLIDSEE